MTPPAFGHLPGFAGEEQGAQVLGADDHTWL